MSYRVEYISKVEANKRRSLTKSYLIYHKIYKYNLNY